MRGFMYPFRRLFLGLIVLVSGFPVFAQTGRGPMIVNIDNPNFRKLVVAIPDFTSVDANDSKLKNLGASGAKELARLLSFSGLFNVIAEEAYSDVVKEMIKNTKPGALSQEKAGLAGVDVVQWKAISVESLTVAEIGKDSDGMTLALRTIDINRSELVLGKKYTKIKENEYNLVIRRYADLLLQAYTGKPGIFSTKLVFVGRKSKKADKQIFVCDFDGSNLVQITKGEYPHVSPSWSSDGRYITFTSFERGSIDVYLYELATGVKKRLSNHKGVNSGSNWSPNNKIIALTGSVEGDADIYYIPSLGGERTLLIRGSGLDVDPAFSPNSQFLAFVSGRYGNPHIFIATLDWQGDNKVRVTGDKRLTYAGWYNATPAWSSLSDKIAFAGYDKDIDRFDLFMMDPDGKNLERLTIRTGDNESPTWAPNGQILYFHSNRVENRNEKNVAQLFLMNRDGSGQRRIDVGLYEAQTPKWSPVLNF